MTSKTQKLLIRSLLLTVMLFAVLPAEVFASCNDPGGTATTSTSRQKLDQNRQENLLGQGRQDFANSL